MALRPKVGFGVTCSESTVQDAFNMLQDQLDDLYDMNKLIGKAAENIAAGGTGTVTVWKYNGSVDAATSETVQATNWGDTGVSNGDPVLIWSDEWEYGEPVVWYFQPANWTTIINTLITSSGAGNRLYGKATANWTNGSPDSVTVNPCSDLVGTVVDTGTVHTVYFPTNAALDPNVIATQVISYQIGTDGVYVTSDGMDAKIFSVKMWAGAPNAIPQGWAFMNGDKNSAVNGGSGLDMTFRFPRCTWAELIPPGSKGGSSQHNHTGATGLQLIAGVTAPVTVLIGDHTCADIVACIADHEDHSHGAIGTATEIVGDPGTTSVEAVSDPAIGADIGNGGVMDTNGVDQAPDGVLQHEANQQADDIEHSVTPHSHGINFGYHNHSIETASHLPPYIVIGFIERINNSA